MSDGGGQVATPFELWCEATGRDVRDPFSWDLYELTRDGVEAEHQ